MDGKILDLELFTEFEMRPSTHLRLRSADSIKYLHIDASNVIYTRDHYDKAHTADWNELKSEFVSIWNLIKKTKKINEVRRIGVVAEYKISCPNNDQSSVLMDKVTKLGIQDGNKKFQLAYETHYPLDKTDTSSTENQEFINVIHQIYDGLIDGHHSEDGYIHVLLDVQHYYAPVSQSSKVIDEVTKLYKVFSEHESELKEQLKKLGLINDE